METKMEIYQAVSLCLNPPVHQKMVSLALSLSLSHCGPLSAEQRQACVDIQ